MNVSKVLRALVLTVAAVVCPAAVVGCGMLLDGVEQPGVLRARGVSASERLDAIEVRMQNLEQQAAMWASGATLLTSGVTAAAGAVKRSYDRKNKS